jgi:metallophosphoesterase superfamily enzyme
MTGEPRDLSQPEKRAWPSNKAELLAASEAIERILSLSESVPLPSEAAELQKQVEEGIGSFLTRPRESQEKKTEYIDRICRIMLLQLQQPGEHARQTCADLYLFYKPLVERGMPFEEPEINEHILEHLVWQIHQDPGFGVSYEDCRQLKQDIEKVLGVTLNVEIPDETEVLESEEEKLMPELERLAAAKELETKDSYMASLDRGIEALRNTEGIVELAHPELTTVVISDIHGRRDYLLERLQQPLEDGITIYELLQQGRINIVCLGDGMHVETRDLFTPKYNREADLLRSLGAMKMVMELKAAFPEHFHYVRGNHDNITDLKMTKQGVHQSEIFLAEARSRFGEDFIAKYQEWEQSLPLLAVVGESAVISHAAPARVLSREAISGRSEAAFFALAWTNNNLDPAPISQAFMLDEDLLYQVRDQGCVLSTNLEIIQGTLKNLGLPVDTPWIIGHRKVEAGIKVQWGQLVQVHHPSMQMAARINPGERMPRVYSGSKRVEIWRKKI